MKRMFSLLFAAVVAGLFAGGSFAQNPQKPRILISSDIGGTDPDDNQSMLHLFMYSDLFDIEGLVSSPSFGDGSKEEILRMIDVYEQDFPVLQKHCPELKTPAELRLLCKQGWHGLAPFAGYENATEGSDWIVQCARREDARPLYVLVWGTLEDVAQALHDAPDIASHIRVYYIGGPNKKWGVNSYSYVAENFPNLWMIENNASYRGLISKDKDGSHYHAGYYDACMKGAGSIGADFINYYKGVVKMGDTPSLLYMMNGNIIKGKASIGLPDEERRHALRLLVKKFAPDQIAHGERSIEKSFHRTEIIRIGIERISGKTKRPKNG